MSVEDIGREAMDSMAAALGGLVTEPAAFDARPRVELHASPVRCCTGECNQGRACIERRPEEDRSASRLVVLVTSGLTLGALAAAAALARWGLPW